MPTTEPATSNLRELAHLLRVRRDSLTLRDVRLPNQPLRFLSGLRRAEVAALAGIDTETYARLERAEEPAPTRETLLAVSKALHLSIVETDYAFELAGLGPPRVGDFPPVTIPAAIEQLVPSLQNVGAILFDRYLTAMRWNAIGDSVLFFSKKIDSDERNAVRRFINDPAIDSANYEELDRRAGEVVTMFRRAYLQAEPTPFARQIYEEILAIPNLAQYWENQFLDEDVFEGGKGPLERVHPVVGSYWIFATNLAISRQQGTFLRIIAPADEASVEQFKRLAELGTPSHRENIVAESPDEAR